MAFVKVDHVGMVVADLSEAQRVFGDVFGMAVDERRTPLPNGATGHFDNVTSIAMPIGEMFVEFSRPNDTNSDAAKFLAERGGRGGMHHVTLASTDIANDVKMLVDRGLKLKVGWDGTSQVLFDPSTTYGIVVGIAPYVDYSPHPAYRGDGLFVGMGHIGLAARATEEARHFWGDIVGLYQNHRRTRGDGPVREERAPDAMGPDDPVSIIEFDIGSTVIEISVPPNDQTGTGRYVAQRATLGMAYHHICPWAPDVHEAIDRAKANGVQQIGGIPPRERTRRATGWIHPRSALGTLLEIWNRPTIEQTQVIT